MSEPITLRPRNQGITALVIDQAIVEAQLGQRTLIVTGDPERTLKRVQEQLPNGITAAQTPDGVAIYKRLRIIDSTPLV